MSVSDPLEDLRLKHSQWSNMYLDQIEPKDYPSLLETIFAAIEAWDKERDREKQRLNTAKITANLLADLRARAMEVANHTETWCNNKTTHHEWCGCQIARKLRKDIVGLHNNPVK